MMERAERYFAALPDACAHDGCITCSDAATPAKVVSTDGDDAVCEDEAGGRVEVAVELVSPVEVGETLLTHGGVAIGRVSEEKAES